MIRFSSLFLLALLFVGGATGCATAGRQTREVLQLSPETLPRSAEVKSVPFINQTENYCGPATLAMAMQWAGKQVTVEQIGPQVFTSGGKGTLQNDLISASRRNGLVAIPLEGMAAMLQEVAAGHPVIVLENQGLSFIPKWHYSIVHGYDLEAQQIVRHSGKKSNAREYLNRFERGAKLANYWSLVVLPPGELSAAGTVLDHVRAASGLEQAERIDEADHTYSSILRKWPNHLAALIGVGNVAYKKKDYSRAVAYLKKAVKLNPDSQQAKHNLAVAEAALKQK